MITKEEWLKELNGTMRFKNMRKKEAEESLYRKYVQQRRHKEIEGYLTEYIPPRKGTGLPKRGWGSDGSVRRSITSTLKNWWSIIKGE
jgi:hypothetical protein